MKICIICEGISDTGDERCVHCSTPLLDSDEVHFPLRRGEADVVNPLLGQVIGGKYRILNVLGKGGMGTVFRAVHEVSLVPVALKVMHPRFGSRPDFRSWFLAEARKAGRVVHENSARVQDVGEARDGTVYIAVEFVDGVTLHEWISGERLLDPATVVDILEQMARALAAAHDAGVVHRDLSPRNVMIAVREGRPFVKILDFGIAKDAPQWIAGRLTDGELGVGAPSGFANPPYSAPEYLAGREVDGRADLYGLGVIGYQALTGRLPVGGHSGPELLRATLDGRVHPLRRVAGAPRRLVRLVNSLLAREPEARPSSAAGVAESLRSIRQRRTGRSASFAVALLTLAAGAFALAYSPASRPHLAGRYEFPLSPTTGRGSVAAQELRRADLAGTTFDFAGFDPASLSVEVSQAGSSLRTVELGPALLADGRLLSLHGGTAGDELLALLVEASASGPVDLTFLVPGHPPLAYKRLRLDDTAPLCCLSTEVPPAAGVLDVLRGATVLLCDIDERCTLAEAYLVTADVQDDGSNRDERRVALELGPAQTRVRLTALDALGGEFKGPHERGRVRLWVEARDRAGNFGESAALDFRHLDLGAPEILSVASPNGGKRLIYGPAGAAVRVQLSEAEPGLTVLVTRPDGSLHEYPNARLVGERLDLELAPATDGPVPFADGDYRFQLRDHIGNVSNEFIDGFGFRSTDPQEQLRPCDDDRDGDPGSLVFIGDRHMFSDGGALHLRFGCNGIYKPVRVDLRKSGGEPIAVALDAVEAGSGRLLLPPLDDGSYELRISIADLREENERELPPHGLRVLARPPVLRLPDVRSATFLPALEDASVLVFADGRLQQGPAWRFSPDDARLLRGRIWFGVDDGAGNPRLGPIELPVLEGPLDPVLSDIRPQRGQNRIALELTDPLGREVQVMLGAAEAPVVSGPGDTRLHQVAAFLYHEEPISPSEPTLRVEFGQTSRLTLRSALPLAPEHAVLLFVGGAPLPPERVERNDSGGADLSFVLPFERVVVAANLGGLRPVDFADERDFPMQARLHTPAGEFQLTLDVRTIRSALTAVRLFDLDGRRIAEDSPLARIRLVPVLGPGLGGEYRDPVPNDAPGRGAFRTTPSLGVRNIRDFYLQDGELTRQQYQAIVDAARGLPAVGGRAGWRKFVHASDPLGAARLAPDNLLPAAHAGRGGDWRAALAAAPERAVAGVDYFQAYTVTRLCGEVLAGDPELLRLPFGLELELAALGATARQVPPILNGAVLRGPGLSLEAYRAAGARLGDPARWPPTAAECRAAGDAVGAEPDAEITGLDFGVREWVMDLPYVERAESRTLLREWLADHARHLQLADGFAAGVRLDVPEDLLAHFGVFSVVRGTALGEPGVVPSAVAARAHLPASVPGVVRGLQLRRDGGGLLPERLDPHLRLCGFRLAGGEQLVQRVRAR